MEIANFIQRQVKIRGNSRAIGENFCAAYEQNLQFLKDLLKTANISVGSFANMSNICCNFRLNLDSFLSNHDCELTEDPL